MTAPVLDVIFFKVVLVMVTKDVPVTYINAPIDPRRYCIVESEMNNYD